MENRRNALIHTIPTHQGTEPPIHSWAHASLVSISKLSFASLPTHLALYRHAAVEPWPSAMDGLRSTHIMSPTSSDDHHARRPRARPPPGPSSSTLPTMAGRGSVVALVRVSKGTWTSSGHARTKQQPCPAVVFNSEHSIS
jgi:hypothetical protein